MDQDKPRDIVDRIDELVDRQLVSGERNQDGDFGDPTFPRCPHCDRHWHGLPVTERIAVMYSRGEFDERYRLDRDDSPVLCRGSDFIGPMPAGRQPTPMLEQPPTGVIWLDDMVGHSNRLLAEMVTGASLPPKPPRRRWLWWRLMAGIVRRTSDTPPEPTHASATDQAAVSVSMHQLAHEIFEIAHRHRADDPPSQ